eukprot:6662813-Prymnesium_polylepis.1
MACGHRSQSTETRLATRLDCINRPQATQRTGTTEGVDTRPTHPQPKQADAFTSHDATREWVCGPLSGMARVGFNYAFGVSSRRAVFMSHGSSSLSEY